MDQEKEDKEILVNNSDNDPSATELLIKKHLTPIYRYLARLVGNNEAAEDLTQETFVRAWKNLKRFDANKPFRPWLYRIARNCAYDYLRKKNSMPFSLLSEGEIFQLENITDENITPLELLEKKETALTVNNLLSKLSDTEKEILTMHYLDDLTVPEIAEILKKPEETIRTRLRRARHAFREAKTQNEPSTSPSNVLISNDHHRRRTQKPVSFAPETIDPSKA